MNFELIGSIFDVVGKVMVAFTAIAVHHRFRKEHKVDEFVFKMMKLEQIIGIFGITFIIIGFFLQLPGKL